MFISAIESALKSVISAEPEITRYDTIAGDGDAGLTLKAGAEGILEEISQNKISDSDVVAAMVEMSSVVEREMGGTSGGLYAILLSGLSKGLIQAGKEQKKEEATVEVWSRGLEVRSLALRRQSHNRRVNQENLSVARTQHALSIHTSPTSFSNPDRPSILFHPHFLFESFRPQDSRISVLGS